MKITHTFALIAAVLTSALMISCSPATPYAAKSAADVPSTPENVETRTAPVSATGPLRPSDIELVK